VQCDIDIIGEAGISAEAELLTATLAAVDALGLEGATIRVNDRRLLIGMLTTLGFPAEQHESALITVDKLDKIGQDGVIAELREKGFDADAFEAFLHRPVTMEWNPFGERAIRKALPDGADDDVVASLVELGDAVGVDRLVFDPFLVRGMGYYTGPVFELAHPSVGYSLGGGGRYDGMIGRFLGSDVPATGFSLGFERLVDLVEIEDAVAAEAVALVYETNAPLAALLGIQRELIARGARVRLVRRPKNLKPALDALARDGFTRFALVGAQTSVETLELRSLV
jgi:histidyl-tRNA synthetase